MDERKMVPREPTEAMADAGIWANLPDGEEKVDRSGDPMAEAVRASIAAIVGKIWRAMFDAAPPAPAPDDVIKSAVDRFLCWQLPRGFAPDCGISFDGRKDDEWNKNKAWPIGTNLLTAEQAREMFTHCLADAISALVAERDMWMTRCAGLMSMLPPETTCGDVRRAALAQKGQRNG